MDPASLAGAAPRVRGRSRRHKAAIAVAALVVLAAAGWFARDILFRLALEGTVALVTGYDVRVGAAHVGSHRLVLRDVAVRRRGDPVLDVAEIDVDYALRDLLAGKRRYGLRRVSVLRPQLYLIRHADGSFNIQPLPRGKPAAPTGAPLRFSLHESGGSVELIDRFNADPAARHLQIGDIDADASVDTAGLTRYRVAAAVLAAGRRFPVEARATIDVARGYAVHRISAAQLPLRGYGDYLIHSRVAQIEAGSLRDLDVRVYSLDVRRTAPIDYHLAGGARLDGVAVKLNVLTRPLEDVRASIGFHDGAVVASAVTGRLGRTPIVGAGGMYDFAKPQFRLAFLTREDLRVLHRDFDFLKSEPLAGPMATTCLVVGDVDDPLILATARSAQVTYRAIPIRDFRATIAYHAGVVFAGDVAGRVGGVRARVAGRFLVGGRDVGTDVALAADAPAGEMPYLDRVVPRAAAHLIFAGTGTGLLLDAHGLIAAAGGKERVSGLFALSPRGVGELAGFTVRQAGGSLAGDFVLDRERGTSALWADARGLRLYPESPGSALRGAGLPAFPPIAGRFDGKLVGVDVATHLILVGEGHAHQAVFDGVPIAAARADLAGPVGNLALGGIDAHGEFGHFTGHGALRAPGFAFEGRLDGTLQGMRRWTGDLGARGNVSGPVAIVSDGTRTLVQTPGMALRHAEVHGVGLRRLAGTFAVEPSRVVIYAASADLAAGRAVARGDSRRGIRFSTGGIAASSLRAAGLPLASGSVLGEGDVRLSAAAAPSFEGGAVLEDGRIAGDRVEGSARLTYADGTLAIDAGSLALARALGTDALARVHGKISGAGSALRYDLRARLVYADLAALARASRLPLPPVSGWLEGDVHVGGAGPSPTLQGTLAIPLASVNGLNVEDARARFAYARGVRAQGSLTVGTTRLRFEARRQGDDIALSLDAPRADLADFDDFFDTADTLAGKGSVRARFARRAGIVSSTGSLDLEGLRFARLPFGHTVAAWNGEPGKIDGSLTIHGTGGSLDGGGTIVVPPGVSLRKLASSARVDLRGTLRDADLNVWVPAFGYTPPVLGHVDATAAVRGRYPGLALDFDGRLLGGRIGRIPIDRLHLSAGTNGNRTQIRSLDLSLAGVDVHGSGSFGLRPNDALALDMDAQVPRIGDLVRRLSGRAYDVDGSARVHLALHGTFAQPSADAAFAVQPLRLSRLVIPSLAGSATIDRWRLALRDAAMNLPDGKVTLSGSAPLVAGPQGIPASTPLSFDLSLQGIGLSQFAALGPPGTTLGGSIDGLVHVGGTIDQPRLVGEVGLTGGSYSGPFETEPVSGLVTDLVFDETSARLARFAASIGGGTVSGGGSLEFPHAGVEGSPYEASFRLSGVRVRFPGYGSARGDGTLSLRGGTPGATPGVVAGDLTISDASIPLAAFLKAGAAPSGGGLNLTPSGQPANPVEPVSLPIPDWLGKFGLNLRLRAGEGVRIRSPILDIGGKGSVQIAGTLDDPSLDGRFEATPGGSLFLNRAFKLQDASVHFSPANGASPYLFARATTQIAPAAGLQPIDVSVTAQGLIPNVKLSYASNPPYDEATIVGLLFDATNLGAQVGSLNTFAPSTNILLPPNAFQQTPAGTFALSQEAASLINAQFTARLLAPIEQSLGSAFGLSDLSINLAPTGSIGVQARRLLGRNVSAVYGTSLQYPYRMTFGLESRPAPETSIVFTAFTQQGLYSFGAVKPDAYLSANPLLGSAADAGGTVGVTVNIQRRFR